MGGLDDYKKVMSEIIQRQMVILGPDISLLKARNVEGLAVGSDGFVTNVGGDPSETLQKLIDEYVALSGLIVKKAMEPLLKKYPNLAVASGVLAK
ncbi:MAG: hypothetical protein NT141_03685 [candidate division WWE3 bacterium]|nr:hypothetical protein [candidate division WWE3 bacterium]